MIPKIMLCEGRISFKVTDNKVNRNEDIAFR